MKDIIIVNPEELERKIKEFKKSGADKLHVLSDFDRTLTTAFVNREKTPSVISILRDGSYINQEYAMEAQALFNKYHPIELDPSIPYQEKKKAMERWWREHFNLLIRSGLNKKDIERAVKSGKVRLRRGVSKLFSLLHEQGVPLVIMSSAGLGVESISLFLGNEDILYDNVFIISNEYEWSDEGRAVRVKEPIIHNMAKKETSVKSLPIYQQLLKRNNVLLFGDGEDDPDMVEGFPYKNLIKIGFLSYDTDKLLERYKGLYDVLILNDGSFDYVNELMGKII